MVQIEWEPKAARQLAKIDRRYIKAIIAKVNELGNWPQQHADIVKMQDTSNKYRLRVGDYRVLFEVVDGIPKIIKIQQVLRRSTRTYKH
jgi:mRNA interferase RelE/StbE